MKNLYKIEDELYIVSDKEKSSYCIKECPMAGLNIDRCDCQIFTACSNKVGNIILTTNKLLIKDGVQEIDDEFLEWFIKNPNCEQISVEEVYFHGSGYYKASELSEQEREKYSFMKKYKIITPKEESTSYTKKCKCMIFEPNCFTGMCKNCGGLPKEEPKTIHESLQEYFKNTPKEKVLEDWNEFQHLDNEGITVNEFLENQKQETLEEYISEVTKNFKDEMSIKFTSSGIKLGAKWQQEQEQNNENSWFNEYQKVEDYIIKRIGDKFLEATPDKYKTASEATIALLENNWKQEQNKNLYSEEDVRKMFSRYNEVIAHRDIEKWQPWIDKQFKKK